MMVQLVTSIAFQRLAKAGLRPLIRAPPVGAVRVMPLGEWRWFHSSNCSERQGPTSPLTSQQKRILYRSKQRGWVELDLILSAFAESRIGSFSHEELLELEGILGEENVVLYGCLVGTSGKYDVPPPHLQDSRIFRSLKDFVGNEYPDIAATQTKQQH